MVTPQLIAYIKTQIYQGIGRDEIIAGLVAVGWMKKDIEAGLQQSENTASGNIPTPPNIDSSRLLGATELLREAWGIFKQRFGTFFLISLIPQVFVFIIGLVVGGGLIAGMALLPNKAVNFTNPVSLLPYLPIVLLFFLAVAIIQLWGQTALLSSVTADNEVIGVKESYRRGWQKLRSYLWISILMGMIVMGGFLLLIIPGLIFAYWFSFAVYILFAEDKKGMTALLTSREYVRGKFGSVFWRFLFILLVTIGAVLAWSLFILLVTQIDKVLGITLLQTIFGFLGNFAFSLLMPLIFIYQFCFYRSLKAVKGEFTEPTGGGKYIAIGILGILAIVIVPILSAVLLVAINPLAQFNKARDLSRATDIMEIQTNLERYFIDNNKYPETLNQLIPDITNQLPTDPTTKAPYEYQPVNDGEDYELCTKFESKPRECVSAKIKIEPYSSPSSEFKINPNLPST